MQAGNERLNRTNPFLRVMSSVMSVLLVVNLVPSEALAEIHLGPRSPSGVPEETPAEVVEETAADHTTKQPPVDILSYLSYTEIEGAAFNGVEYEVTESTPVVVKYAFEETVGNQFLDDYEYYFRLPDAFLPSNGQPYLDDSIVVGYHDGGQTNYISISNNQWYIANNEVHFSWNQSDGSGFSFMQAQELTSFELRIEGTFLPDYSAVDFGAGYINLKFPDQYADESDEGYEEEQPQQQQPTSTSTVFEFGSTSELVQEGVPVTEGDAQKQQKETDPAKGQKTDPNKPETAATDPAQQATTPGAADATDKTETNATGATDEQAEQKTTNPGTVSQFTYEDDQVLVIANVADPSVFPEGAELKVKPIPSYQGEFNNYIAALNNASDKTYDEDNTILFDIAFFLNGEEIQPTNGTVDVTIKFKKYQLKNEIGAASLANVEVNHLPVVDGNVVVENVDAEVSVKNEVAQLNAESFSVYAFSYTVDFTFGGYTYKMPGSGSITLSSLLVSLGINESVSAVDSVDFSNPAVLQVERDFRSLVGSDWTLKSLASFSNPETLTLKMNNGSIYLIEVCDPEPTDSYAHYSIKINNRVIGHIKGDEEEYEFSFYVKPDSNDDPNNYTIDKITLPDKKTVYTEGEFTLDDVIFKKTGVYILNIYEGLTRTMDEIANDNNIHKITFEVKNNPDGSLYVDSATPDEPLIFNNRKCVTLHIHKKLADATNPSATDIVWPNGAFANILLDSDTTYNALYGNDEISSAEYASGYGDAVIKLVYNSGDISPEPYTYELYEQLTGTWPSGWKVDDYRVKAEVTVMEPSEQGEAFDYSVKYYKEQLVDSRKEYHEVSGYGYFTNVYQTGPTSLTISVQKTIDNLQSWRVKDDLAYSSDPDATEEEKKIKYAGDSFRFYLVPCGLSDTDPQEFRDGVQKEGIVTSDNGMGYSIVIDYSNNDGNNNYKKSFPSIKLDKVGYYKFRVTEEAKPASITDITYDTQPKYVYVYVYDNGKGSLEAEMVAGSSNLVEVENTYKGCTVPISIAKEASGEWPTGGEAVFKLTPINGAPEPTGVTSLPFTEPATKSFGELHFTNPGTYEYEIYEDDDPDLTKNFEAGWTKKPEKVRVIVKIGYSLNSDHKAESLVVESVDVKDQNGAPRSFVNNTINFRNEYVGTGDLLVIKEFQGIMPKSDLKDTIEIVVTDGAGKEHRETLKDGSATFEKITAGVCTVTESGEEVAGYVVDTKYKLPSSSEMTTEGKVKVIGDGSTSVIYIYNKYSVSNRLRVKEVIGKGEWPTGGKVTVSLGDTPAEYPKPSDISDKVLDGPGSYADFGQFITPISGGKNSYDYTIYCKNDFGSGWVTEPSIIIATLNVNDDGSIESITYKDASGKDVNAFTNSYIGKGTLKISKSISGLTPNDEIKSNIKTIIEDDYGNSFIKDLNDFKNDGNVYTCSLDNITAGTYNIYEDSNIDGYKLYINNVPTDGTKFRVCAKEIIDGKTEEATYADRYTKASTVTVNIKVEGDDWTESEESAVVVNLIDKNGNTVNTSHITKSGDDYIATFESVDLYPYNNTLSGTYSIQEEHVPEKAGYAVVVSEPQIEVKGDGADVSATVTNTYVEKGKLEIIKEVSGTTLSDSDIRNISFNITSDNGYSNSIGLSDFDVVTSGTKFSHIEEGLDAGTYYLTEEVSTKKENYDLETTYSSSSESGSSVENTKKVTITVKNAYTVNVRGTGRLTVSNKVVSNTDSDKTKSFKYTVKLSGTTGSLVSGTYGDMTFKDGVATFSLAGGDSVSASELPTVGYTVTQDSVSGYNTTSSGASGTISSNSRASFTNTKTENNNSNNSSSNSSNSSNTNSNSNNSSSNNSNKNTNSNTTTGSNSKVTIKLTANKRLTGRTLVANEFSFALRDGNGNLLQTKTNTSSGSVAFDGIDLSAEGTYYYVISEVKGSAADITYDTHQARVTVTVTKDSSGTFTAKAAYDSSNSTTFNNTYTGTGSTATAANGSSSSASKTSTAGTAATTTQANKDNLAKTADPTLFTALPMLVTAGAASVAAGVIRRRKRK